jgi:lipoprotein signal peptidase
MYYLEIALFVVGLIVLVVGYRKNQRNVLLTAAILLFLSGALGSAVDGFSDGFNQVRTVQ